MPLLVFLAVGLFIAANTIPGVREGLERLARPQIWAARQTCRDAALALARNPDFARILDSGAVHRTRNGSYVEGLVMGEMGETGEEIRRSVDCYVDPQGRLVNRHVSPEPATSGDRAPGREGPPHEGGC